MMDSNIESRRRVIIIKKRLQLFAWFVFGVVLVFFCIYNELRLFAVIIA